MRNRVALAPVAALSACALLCAAPGACAQYAPVQGIVLVADGSGDFRTLTSTLNQVVQGERLPLYIETFIWSHGRGRYLKDHMDHCNHLVMGRALAERALYYRRQYPGAKVFLLGHSAGCAVALAAGDCLPPDSVDRIILMAPSVSPGYDLRRSLAAAREGIDAFVSDGDRIVLDLCMRIVGTADGRRGPAAGRVGFCPTVSTPADAALHTRLRQHTWHPAVSWTGHLGGHYGTNRLRFVQAYVVPLFFAR